MKREEKTVETYFKSIGFQNIVFEPKGNRTPDFVIDEKIAIEVRRLNQFYNGIPIEKVKHNLLPKIISQIEAFKKESYSKSAFVGIRYTRPINYNKKIKDLINAILENHSSIMETSKKYKINDNLELEIFPSDKKLDTQYHFGSSIDFNEGGFVLANIYNSLKIIIPEKSKQIENYKSEYKTWWLALVDNIGNGLSQTEFSQLREIIDFNLYFDKVFIISNLNPINGGEI
ncbi:hypothetical protein AAGV28_05320 [Flavobacterium sp. FZUC8N2.13]|uniref:Restriction endonuclease n=1 Tax=Flavobacterium zubiriense TaxID=3138075 RepID=A0ABV4TCT1_9FLAO